MKRGILDTYHVQDARNILSVLPPEPLVDTTITSPPYWNLKDYGSKKQVGFGQKYEDYLADIQDIFAGVYRVTKRTGSLWVIADTIKHNGELKLFPFDLASRLRQNGWVLHDIIVWHKDKTLPWSHRGKLRNIFEYILFFSKAGRFKYYINRVRETEGLKGWWVRYPERYSPQGKAPTRTWSIPIPRQGSWGENWVRHFCPLPPELVRRIVLLTTKRGDVVLDPFAGSGVVLAEASALHRHFVGLDLRAKYRRMFERRVRPSVLALEEEREKSKHGEKKTRQKFSAMIWKLRKTKYPRELLRLYEKHHGRLGAAGMIAVSRRTRSLEVTFIFTHGIHPPRTFSSRIERLQQRPPLSKYGLRVSVRAHNLSQDKTSDRARESLRAGEMLSVYRDRNAKCEQSPMTTADFLESLRNGGRRDRANAPPLGSNVRVATPPRALA